MAGVSGGEASGSEVSEAWIGVGEDEMSKAGWEKVMHGQVEQELAMLG